MEEGCVPLFDVTSARSGAGTCLASVWACIALECHVGGRFSLAQSWDFVLVFSSLGFRCFLFMQAFASLLMLPVAAVLSAQER